MQALKIYIRVREEKLLKNNWRISNLTIPRLYDCRIFATSFFAKIFFLRTKSFEFHDEKRLKNNGKEHVTYGYRRRYIANKESVEYKL